MRDWSTLRQREWQPVRPSNKDGPGADAGGPHPAEAGRKVRPGNDGHSAAWGTGASAASSSRSWCTDTEIGASRAGGRQSDLKRWEDEEAVPPRFNGTLEELSGSHKSTGHWDQFEVNERLFGVVSTFKADLSQYTTPLDLKRVPAELRRRADQLAQDVVESDGEEDAMDEEGKFSAVPRSGGELLATLRASAGQVPVDTDYRSLVASKVQGWWRARSSTGAPVPPGAEDSLICPFSHKVFGDVSQLVMHWAAALPRGEEAATPASAATEQFRHLGRQMRWSELAAIAGLGSTLSVEAPRPGSVWAQLLARLERSSSSKDQPFAERLVGDFVSEAVLMRCWRREQKVEHRQVLEGIAAGLALHALEVPNGPAWCRGHESP
mmetsp:Transcript_13810/g.39527  ORF Transcript_13810/g.39527 Transcript_13810/m.39527 type:complete len:380 (-) Transcript_13810:110-1249(-)